MEHLHGAVSLEQFKEAGLSRWTVNRRVRSGDLRRIAGTVHALPGAPDGLRLTLAGGCLAVGSKVCVTGASAAHLRGFHPREPRTGHLATPATRARFVLPGLDVRREVHFDAIPLQVVDGLACAGVNWTLMDAARDLGEEDLARAIATADALRSTSLNSLASAAASRGRWHGSARFRKVLSELRGELTHSGDERRARRHLREVGLHPHPRPYDVVVAGRTIAQADIAFLAERLDVEIDGPTHFLKGAQEKDRRRDRRMQAAGWIVLRFTVYEVRNNPEGVVAEILDALATRRRQLSS